MRSSRVNSMDKVNNWRLIQQGSISKAESWSEISVWELLKYCALWPLIHLQAKETKVLIFPIMTFPVYSVWNFNYSMKDKKLARCIKWKLQSMPSNTLHGWHFNSNSFLIGVIFSPGIALMTDPHEFLVTWFPSMIILGMPPYIISQMAFIS